MKFCHAKSFCLAIVPLASILFSWLPVWADSTYDGWWFDPDQQGSGLSLEIQGYTMFAALYTYSQEASSAGYPVWYSSAAVYNPQQNTYSGRLLYWINGSDEDIYPANPTPVDVGIFVIQFTGPNDATLIYGPDAQPIGPINLKKFMNTMFPGQSDERLKGWWYDPSYDGWGFFLEAQGGTLFGAWYFYMPMEDGSWPIPTWVSFGGDFQNGSSSFSAPVSIWSSGSLLGALPYQAPQQNFSGYNAYLNIKSDGTIDISASGDDEVLHLRRFRFGSQ